MAALRWCVNVNVWNPTAAEFERCMRLLPPVERECCHSLRHQLDKKRALVSRLLQRRAVHEALGISYDQIDIRRTKGKKPFLFNRLNGSNAVPNFNFNVAHEGHYVVLASEPVCLCGVDVSAPEALRRRHRSMREQSFIKKILTELELSGMTREAASDAEFDVMFQRHWALKEAFVKARGDGVAFGLKKVEFDFGSDIWSNSPILRLKGVTQKDWSFTLHELPGSHWIAVARGPPEAAVDQIGEFQSTFAKPHLSLPELQGELTKEEPAFTVIDPEQLMPASVVQE